MLFLGATPAVSRRWWIIDPAGDRCVAVTAAIRRPKPSRLADTVASSRRAIREALAEVGIAEKIDGVVAWLLAD